MAVRYEGASLNCKPWRDDELKNLEDDVPRFTTAGVDEGSRE